MCFTFNKNEDKMKKFLYISLLALAVLSMLSLASCKNEVDNIFDEDAVIRLDKAKAEYRNILTSNGGKWQLEYFANENEKGYVYLMTFFKDGSVKISGNNEWINYIKTGSAKKPAFGSEVSMWDVIADNGPVLSLNTYNQYFHFFADPYDIPNTTGGATDADINESGYGHEGNYEFDIMKFSGDTLYLTGKKPTRSERYVDMIMTRVDGGIDDETYLNEVDSMKTLFFNTLIPQVYINLPNGIRWIVKNGASSILKMYREGDDEITTSETHNIIITHDGLSFMDPITLDGYVIKNFIRQADGSLLCRDDNQTTMTADVLSGIFTNQTTYVWRSKPANMGGSFAEMINDVTESLYANFNKATLEYVQIAKESDSQIFSFYVKRGSRKDYLKYTVTMDPMGDNQVRFTVDTGNIDQLTQSFSEKCPAMKPFVEAFAAATYDLTSHSLLSPTDIKMSQSGNAGNYITWTLSLK